jgi:hypothetical protein
LFCVNGNMCLVVLISLPTRDTGDSYLSYTTEKVLNYLLKLALIF